MCVSLHGGEAVLNLWRICVGAVVEWWLAVAGSGAQESARTLNKDTRKRHVGSPTTSTLKTRMMGMHDDVLSKDLRGHPYD